MSDITDLTPLEQQDRDENEEGWRERRARAEAILVAQQALRQTTGWLQSKAGNAADLIAVATWILQGEVPRTDSDFDLHDLDAVDR